jgi:hypothetical protein
VRAVTSSTKQLTLARGAHIASTSTGAFDDQVQLGAVVLDWTVVGVPPWRMSRPDSMRSG